MSFFIRMDRILSSEQVRVQYGFPKDLFAKVKPCLPVLCRGDDGQDCHLESCVDQVLKRLAKPRELTAPQPGRPDTTTEIADYVENLRVAGRSWKEIFKACKGRWPNDDRAQKVDQVRSHWRRHYGDQR